ncbi:MAG: enoyl-CoA hydratase/isomerase family protein [Actinobacteria bacterium]|nr:enoyl-CoA hydratase/isomerase family protein [Actinomycetota bacterium]
MLRRVEGRVHCLLVNRPSRRNALDPALVEALVEAIEEPGEAAVLVLGAAAPGMFCSGADLDLPDGERAALSDRLYDLYGEMRRCPLPIVAALDGPAVGGGAQLAIAADVRIASSRARLRFAGAGHGLAVGAWGLPSLVGRGRAAELCLSMRTVASEEALAIGLVDTLAETPLEAALELGAGLARLDPGAVARVKRGIDEASGLAEALRAERAGNGAWDGRVPSVGRVTG